MKRLSFLKTMGVGIAAAVITPKILVDALPREITPSVIKKKEEYGHYEENWVHSTDPDSLRLWDMVMNESLEIYAVTGIGLGIIELKALDCDTNPNFLDIEKSHFSEYFIIMGSAFNEGKGMPT